MKSCVYCGRGNSDDAAHCAGCGTAEFVVSDVPSPIKPEGETSIERNAVVRDRPKFVIVLGIWAMYLPGLAASIFVLFSVLAGNIVGARGFYCFLLSLGGCVFCTYMLYRVVKNYNMHKKRAAEDTSQR